MAGIPDGSRVLLDTVALVYFLERHPRYGATAQAIFRRIAAGRLRALIASLVFAELLVPLHRQQDREAAESLVDLLSNFHNLEVVSGSTAIMVEASRLRALYGLRTLDAIHAATALRSSADGIVSNDKRLSR
ncbi:MAG: type II toxin-antitoxin system VapC family toxin, partial [Serratia inhibens]|uniref:type II toxin-antitoxin system VapC family toxin n=1 Tax=Serratia inhibens TaxID=2338073 RepID=UPI003C7DC4D2